MKKSGPKKMAVGDTVLIRTVTHYYVGQVATVDKEEIALSAASWVSDTGRFSEALAKGTLGEVESYGDLPCHVQRGAMVDWCPWPHSLPTATK